MDEKPTCDELMQKVKWLQKKLGKFNLMEQAFLESEVRYCKLVERSDDGIIIVQESVIKESNSLFAKMSGYGIEDIVGFLIDNLIFPSGSQKAMFLNERCEEAENTVKKYKADLIRKQGGRMPVEVNAVIITSGGKPAELMIIRDISDRDKVSEELAKAKQLESIAALSGGIAHDYNNLLTAIMGNISLAQASIQPDDKVADFLSEAQNAAILAKDLTRKLITFSKGGAPVKRSASIAPLVKRATEFSLSGSNIKCAFSFPDNLRAVEIDETQIGQAIYNLVINAKESMPGGGYVKVAAENISINNDIFSLKIGDYVKISIEDQGVGISEENLTKIFDPYFSTKEVGGQKGMGLGLSICHSIIKRHGGDVAVQSQNGIGTTFHIFIPASECEISEDKPAGSSEKESPMSGKGRVLVMDDEAMIRELAVQMLTYLGYEVVCSEDGEEAIELYKKAMDSGKRFDIVVLDLTVRGGMGGKETMTKLLEIDYDVRGIVSSGYSENLVMSDFKTFGFIDAIPKPYKLNELARILHEVITMKKDNNATCFLQN